MVSEIFFCFLFFTILQHFHRAK